MATTASTPSTQARDGSPAEAMSYDEAMRRYEGEWLLLRVLRFDQRRLPALVEVLARGSQEQVFRASAEHGPGTKEAPLYLVEAAQYIRAGAEARKALAELAERELAEDEELRGPGVHRWR